LPLKKVNNKQYPTKMNLLSTEKGYAVYLKLNVLYVGGKNAVCGNPAMLN